MVFGGMYRKELTFSTLYVFISDLPFHQMDGVGYADSNILLQAIRMNSFCLVLFHINPIQCIPARIPKAVSFLATCCFLAFANNEIKLIASSVSLAAPVAASTVEPDSRGRTPEQSSSARRTVVRYRDLTEHTRPFSAYVRYKVDR